MFRPYIFHIDFDCYFVSAIRALKPNLKNKPIAIANKHPNAVAISVSYDLRDKGIRAGWKVSKILQLEPKTIIEQPRFDLYITTSNAIFRHLKKYYAKQFEIGSIDECYLLIPENIDNDEKAMNYAQKIQTDVYQNFSIPITIGISKTKFYAKMTTNYFKPNKIGLTNESNYQERFFNLDIIEYHGIGKRLSERFKDMQINTIGDLYQLTPGDIRLTTIFRTAGIKFLQQLDFFQNNDTFQSTSDIKGISRDITFHKKEIDTDFITKNIEMQAEKVSQSLQRIYKVGNLISFGIRTFEQGWIIKHQKISEHIDKATEIAKICIQMYYDYFINHKIIGISIRISELINSFENFRNLSILQQNKPSKSNYVVDQIIYKVNTTLKQKSLKTLADYNIDRIKKRRGQSDQIEVGVFKR
ncbi:DNA polymerase-4 [Mycoplasmopsis mustelae]|uniref:DNA polymerase-4 n=1 Tax=Mycoplasmopsis mustelae TaxID=171289 RepID=A0A4R7UC11_9BACT|nr:DNA polymerase IV [Mycoplasmopsis mustelae]TDV23042.1 DNA polymerase-4 [Mycoplasmopsis mustelae]